MLETPVIMRVSDIEETIADYKYGLYSDHEFVQALRTKTRELEDAIQKYEN